MSRIAISSIDNEYVDEHFGHALYFQIYDIYPDGYRFVETRNSFGTCRGNCEGGFEHIYNKLTDCEAVFTLKIGEHAAAYMISKNIRVFEARGKVDELLEQLQQNEEFANEDKANEEFADKNGKIETA